MIYLWPDFNDLISSKSKCIPISILFIDFIWAASKNYWTFPNKVDYWGFLVPAKNNIYRGVVDYKNARLQQTKDTLFCYIPLSLQYFQMIPPSVHVWSDIFIHFPPCCDIKLALGDAAPSWFCALRCIVLPSDGSRMLDNSLNSLRKTSCPSSGGPPKYLGQLLTGFTRRPPPSEVIVRKRQAEVRLKYLEDGNFPANKFEVLPGLREFVRDNHDWREQLGLVSEDLSDIESRSTNDTQSLSIQVNLSKRLKTPIHSVIQCWGLRGNASRQKGLNTSSSCEEKWKDSQFQIFQKGFGGVHVLNHHLHQRLHRARQCQHQRRDRWSDLHPDSSMQDVFQAMCGLAGWCTKATDDITQNKQQSCQLRTFSTNIKHH